MDNKDIITQLVQSAKKVPTSIVGGGVDLANMVLGGYANIAQTIQGKPITREAGEGLVKNPIGGTEHLNSLAGIDSKSGGLTEDSVSGMLSALSPGGLAKGAMIVPAVLLKEGSAIRMAEKMLAKGTDPKAVWKELGIFKDAEGTLKSVIPDEMAALKIRDDLGGKIGQLSKSQDRIVEDANSKLKTLPNGKVSAPFEPTRLGDVLDHPQLFEVFPELADIHVKSGASGGARGEFHAGKGEIRMADADPNDFLSTLLHETQHGVQHTMGAENFGAAPAMFFRDLPTYNKASTENNKQIEDIIQKSFNNPAPDMLEIRAASRINKVFKGAKDKAFSNYSATSGEVEARATQTMHELGRYDQFPPDVMDTPFSSQILDPWTHPKVDDDPLVKAVVSYMNDVKAANPGK